MYDLSMSNPLQNSHPLQNPCLKFASTLLCDVTGDANVRLQTCPYIKGFLRAIAGIL